MKRGEVVTLRNHLPPGMGIVSHIIIHEATRRHDLLITTSQVMTCPVDDRKSRCAFSLKAVEALFVRKSSKSDKSPSTLPESGLHASGRRPRAGAHWAVTLGGQ